jgi:F-box/leucine-rich repeat protein 10/11
MDYFKKYGFKTPLVCKEQKGLGLRVPSESFSVDDVKRCVGSQRVLDVMDVSTQKALTMTMKDWCTYYADDNKKRERLLNVISLEFSHTKLEQYIQVGKLKTRFQKVIHIQFIFIRKAPLIVRQLDWYII